MWYTHIDALFAEYVLTRCQRWNQGHAQADGTNQIVGNIFRSQRKRHPRR
jgi:hypothetical protein